MCEVNLLKDRDYCTKSVLKFLRSSSDLLQSYFETNYERGSLPNYSDFLRKVVGTTAEKVNLASIYVVRSTITEYMLAEYYRLYPDTKETE